MLKYCVLITCTCLLVLASCSKTGTSIGSKSKTKELDKVVKLMSGTFSSRAQAKVDSAYFDINLVMFPVWTSETDAKWLYVEQAATAYIDKPYRQRMYKVTSAGKGQIKSAVYELPDPEKFIHAWDNPRLFDSINPDSLIIRQGCAVYLKKDAAGCYSGATKDKECGSTLRGASYASSIVTICESGITSWDQGWNSTGEQVWGAVKGAYVFDKID